MIDNITISLDAKMPVGLFVGNNAVEFNEKLFIPKFSIFGDVTEYYTKYKNLYIKFRPARNKLIIANSLHKFYHGNNYTDFTLTEAHDVVEELSDELSHDIFSGEIKRIECGCNIHVPDVTAAYQQLKSYQGKLYQPEWHNSKLYGTTCRFTNYVIKAYNKTFQVKALDNLDIRDNLFRFEVKTTCMDAFYKRKIPLVIENVADLFDKIKARNLSTDTLDKYRNSIRDSLPSKNNLPLKDLTALARIQDTAIANIMRINHRDTFNNDQKTFRRIMKETETEKKIIEKLLEEKFEELLN